MNRGLVVEINKRNVIVLTPDGRFRKVPGRGGERIGEEIELPSAARLPSIRRKIALAAAALLLFIIPLLGKQTIMAHPVVAYLTVDVNPSIEIGIDKHDAVRKLVALNDEAMQIVAGMPYRGKPVDAVLGSITARLDKAHYLDSLNHNVLITSIVVDTSKMSDTDVAELRSSAKEAVRKAMGPDKADTIEITTIAATEKVREAADRNGVSAGKMTVYLMAKNKGFSINLQELKTKSIPEIANQWGGLQSLLNGQENTDADQLNLWVDSDLALQKTGGAPSSEASGKDGDQPSGSKQAPDGKQEAPNGPEGKPGSPNPSAPAHGTKTPPDAHKEAEKNGDSGADSKDRSGRDNPGGKADGARPDSKETKQDRKETKQDSKETKQDRNETQQDSKEGQTVPNEEQPAHKKTIPELDGAGNQVQPPTEIQVGGHAQLGKPSDKKKDEEPQSQSSKKKNDENPQSQQSSGTKNGAEQNPQETSGTNGVGIEAGLTEERLLPGGGEPAKPDSACEPLNRQHPECRGKK